MKTYETSMVTKAPAYDGGDDLVGQLNARAQAGWRFVQIVGGESAPFMVLFEKEDDSGNC